MKCIPVRIPFSIPPSAYLYSAVIVHTSQVKSDAGVIVKDVPGLLGVLVTALSSMTTEVILTS